MEYEYRGPIRFTVEDYWAREGKVWWGPTKPNGRQDWKLKQVREDKRYEAEEARFKAQEAQYLLRRARRRGAGDAEIEALWAMAEAAEEKAWEAEQAAEAVRTPWQLTGPHSAHGGTTPAYGGGISPVGAFTPGASPPEPEWPSRDWSCLERHHIATWRAVLEAKRMQRQALGGMTVAEARQLVEENSSLTSILKAKAERIKQGGGQRRQLPRGGAAKKRPRGPAVSLPKPGPAKKQETATTAASAAASLSLSGGQDDETDQWMQ